MRLNLGCGNNYLDGYVNIDASKAVKTDVRANILTYKYDLGVVEEVLLSHVIEHLEREQAIKLLKRLKTSLTNEGIIKVIVPIIDGGLDWEKKGKLAKGFFQQIIYGERTNKYEVHKYAYTKDSIMQLMIDAELTIVRVLDIGWQYEVWSKK